MATPLALQKKVGQASYQGWLELDRVLAMLWESHSIRPRVIYNVRARKEKGKAKRRVKSLLSEVTARGIVDLEQM